MDYYTTTTATVDDLIRTWEDSLAATGEDPRDYNLDGMADDYIIPAYDANNRHVGYTATARATGDDFFTTAANYFGVTVHYTTDNGPLGLCVWNTITVRTESDLEGLGIAIDPKFGDHDAEPDWRTLSDLIDDLARRGYRIERAY